ncbi:MAG: hypothetical protein CFE37_02240 [Alphaproteobacteria bacterium PA4]|nr:MAG: hypothetical protein CFE37_02240 [Alphaproteobacteria bacterium PA4]
MPLHYALTDGLVALVGLLGALWLWRRGLSLGAAGVALFGLAGAIGVTRITSGAIDSLAGIHRFASQVGGLAGLWLITAEIARGHGWRLASPLIIIAAITALAVLVPASLPPLFILGLLAGCALLWFGDGPQQRAPFAALGFALMLPNVLFVRQAPLLTPDLRWHVYHLLVALWLLLIVRQLTARGGVRG